MTLDFLSCFDGQLSGRVFLLIGLVVMSAALFKLACWLFNSFVRPAASLKTYVAKGKWAVITGASDGIGKGYAQELARRGANLVLISRTASKLEELERELMTKYKVEVQSVPADFSRPDAELYPAIEEALRGKQVSILINNVGINTDIPVRFGECPIEESERLVRVNVNSALRMTHLVLPRMVDNKEGLVINLGSFTGDFPTPMLAVYSATKTFIDTWTKAMAAEYRSSKIHFMCVKPAYVMSSMTGLRRESFTTVSPAFLARETFARVGRVVSTSPVWRHNVMEFATRLIPKCFLMSHMLKTMQHVRKRKLERASRGVSSEASSSKGGKRE